MSDGRGVIYALPHMGDFEQAGRWVILAGAGSIVTPVAERLKPESVFQMFLDVPPGPRHGSAADKRRPAPVRRDGAAAAGRKAGHASSPTATCPTPAWRWTSSARRRCSPPGLAALAVQTGAALMPVACWFVGEDEWGAHIHDEIPVPADGDRKQKVAAMTQAMARVFEQGISEHPEDWHMLQKVFVNDLDPERLARSRARAAQRQRPRDGNGARARDRADPGPHADGAPS